MRDGSHPWGFLKEIAPPYPLLNPPPPPINPFSPPCPGGILIAAINLSRSAGPPTSGGFPSGSARDPKQGEDDALGWGEGTQPITLGGVEARETQHVGVVLKKVLSLSPEGTHRAMAP